MSNVIQQILAMQKAPEQDNQTLDSYLDTPEAQTAIKRQALEDQMGKMEEFLSANPQNSLNEALQKAKPQTKKGKVMGVIGEVLAGLARAPYSPQMQKEAQVRSDWKMNYDNQQQNIKDRLGMAKMTAKEIDEANKLDFQKHKLKLTDLGRKEGLDQKAIEFKIKSKMEADKLALAERKLDAQIKSATSLDDYRRGMLRFKQEGGDENTIAARIAGGLQRGEYDWKTAAKLYKEFAPTKAPKTAPSATMTTKYEEGKPPITTVKEPYKGVLPGGKPKGGSGGGMLDQFTVSK